MIRWILLFFLSCLLVGVSQFLKAHLEGSLLCFLMDHTNPPPGIKNERSLNYWLIAITLSQKNEKEKLIQLNRNKLGTLTSLRDLF